MKDRKKTKKHFVNDSKTLRRHTAELELLVNERKGVEDEIKALKQEMEFILGVTKTGLDIIDSEFNVRYIDPEWAKVYGDPAGKKCHEYFMGKKEVCPACGIPQALKTKKPVITEEVLVKENNRPVQVTTIPFKNEAGVWLVAEVNVDITERKKMEEAQHEDEWRLNRAQEIAHLGSWELDLGNNRLTCSDEMYRIFGLQPQEFGATYEAFLDTVHPDDRAAVRTTYSKSVHEGRDTFEIEHRVVRKSTGEPRIVHARCVHIRDASGRVIRSIGMVHDITERKRVEEEREKLIQNLQDALAKIRRLQGMLPICISCKKIRDDEGYWMQLEAYIEEHSEAEFTHGICPDCLKKLYGISLEKDGSVKRQ